MSEKYRINEIFYSLQGEGGRAGSANIFVRFSGCNLTCSIEEEGFDCDTEFTSGKNHTIDELWGALTPFKCRNVIFTGGEPSLQLDLELIDFLKDKGYYLAIETNGTKELPKGLDWICVSPKSAEHTLRERWPNELKYVRNVSQEIPRPSIEADYYYISPAFESDGTVRRETLDHCIQLVKDNPLWRLSVQQHKLFKIR